MRCISFCSGVVRMILDCVRQSSGESHDHSPSPGAIRGLCMAEDVHNQLLVLTSTEELPAAANGLRQRIGHSALSRAELCQLHRNQSRPFTAIIVIWYSSQVPVPEALIGLQLQDRHLMWRCRDNHWPEKCLYPFIMHAHDARMPTASSHSQWYVE